MTWSAAAAAARAASTLASAARNDRLTSQNNELASEINDWQWERPHFQLSQWRSQPPEEAARLAIRKAVRI